MGRPRSELSAFFHLLTANVYFQAPSLMDYPCIKYDVDDDDVTYADNMPHIHYDGYQVTIIDHDPDSFMREAMKTLPMCRFVRHYVADDLHHFVYLLFF